MKFLVVDDSQSMVESVVNSLRKDGHQVVGLTPQGGVYGERLSMTTAIKEADVIFLDHNMPGENGDQWIQSWKESEIDFSKKRVIGISSDKQPYLSEQIGWYDIEKTVREIASK